MHTLMSELVLPFDLSELSWRGEGGARTEQAKTAGRERAGARTGRGGNGPGRERAGAGTGRGGNGAGRKRGGNGAGTGRGENGMRGGKRGRSAEKGFYSHSMVAGGLLVTSRTTRFTSGTSLVTRVEIRASTSSGSRAQSAVIASSLVTGRSTIGWP